MTPDDLPMIGQPGEWSNLKLATGHNMLGMSMAAATGRLIAELVAGRRPHIDPTPFNPDRFA
jgi:D-amino-acid dehydrogenase